MKTFKIGQLVRIGEEYRADWMGSDEEATGVIVGGEMGRYFADKMDYDVLLSSGRRLPYGDWEIEAVD